MHPWAMICLVFTLFAAVLPNRSAIAATQLSSPFQPSPLQHQHIVPQQREMMTALVQQAELIVRGRVIAIESSWHTNQRLIESRVTIDVAYTLQGRHQETVTVRTSGGYLAEEGIGMISMHAAAFAEGEEVLLFLEKSKIAWRVVNDAAGKFQVYGERVVNQDWAHVESIDGLLSTILHLSATRGQAPVYPFIWHHIPPTTKTTPFHPRQAQRAMHKWPTPHATATFYVNINSRQSNDNATADAISTTALRNAILTAANRWSNITSADFTLKYGGATGVTQTGYNGRNEILFMAKGRNARAAAAEVWYTKDLTIVEADIWINDDYRWDITGKPAADEVDLQSALVHEFGHWLILGHSAQDESVMFPKLSTGKVKRVLQAEDIAGISAIYPQQ